MAESIETGAAAEAKTEPNLQRSFKLEMAARIGAVLLFVAPSLIPILAPDWDWPGNHRLLINCGGIPFAFIFYTCVHALSQRAAGQG
jgi:hypothetical protein